MRVFENITDLIGKTPLLSLDRFASRRGAQAHIYGKLEWFNPLSSVKDRSAYGMILAAEQQGVLKPGATIIEATSGNMGIGLTYIAAARGYRIILTMPETMSVERRKLLAALGAKIVLTPGNEAMAGAIAKAKELAAQIEGSFMPMQFDNPANAQAHFDSTGPEIWDDTDGTVDIFVAGVGTGGTVSGVGNFLKQKKSGIKVIAVEPFDSPVLAGGRPGAHPLQGLGAGFVPAVFDRKAVDEIIPVRGPEAVSVCRELAATEGVMMGISAGAALHVAIEMGKRSENAGKTIVVLLPDTGERYLSTELFEL